MEAMRQVRTGLVWATAKVSGETMTSLQIHTQVRHSTPAGHCMVTKRIKSCIVAEWAHGSHRMVTKRIKSSIVAE